MISLAKSARNKSVSVYPSACRKSWADREGIPTGVEGETYRGIWIRDENRATVFEFRKAGIEVLRKIAVGYNAKGVKAVLYGTQSSNGHKYAVYVQDGFLREVGEDE